MLTQASQAQCLQASIHEAYALPLLQENIWLTIPISHQFLVRPKYVSKGNHPSWRIVTLVSLSKFKQRLLLPLIVTSWLKSNVKRNWFRSSIGYAAISWSCSQVPVGCLTPTAHLGPPSNLSGNIHYQCTLLNYIGLPANHRGSRAIPIASV